MSRYLIIFCLLSCFNAAGYAKNKQQVFNIADYGAVSDGVTDNTKAIQKTIDACSANGGGKVVIPPGGTFLSGPFELKSHIEFEVEAGARLLANPDEHVYVKSAFRDNVGEGTLWMYGHDIENVTLSGAGTIDGNGIAFMGKELADSYELKPFNIVDPRPHLLTIIGGKNIRIRELTIRNSAYWTVHLIGCNDVAIDNLTLLNNLKVRNSDGIDVDHSKNVRISNSYIESGDDCICLKNRREFAEYGICENIVVNNCTMTSRSCAIKIGSENMDSIRHVLFNNCIITKSNRGIGIQNRDEGTVTDVVFSNIIVQSHLFSDVWWGKAEPIYVTAYRRATANNKDAGWRLPKGQTEGRVGRVSNIYFSNIVCSSENGVYVAGETDKISDINFDRVYVTINKTTTIPGGVYDRRPSNVEGLVKSLISGFYVENARAVTIQNSTINWGDSKPEYFGYAIQSKNTETLKINNFAGEAAFPEKMVAIKKD